MTSVEALVKELSEVQDLLVKLPDDAFVERERLIRRRADLQAAADTHAAGVDVARPKEDLRAELEMLRMRMKSAPSGERTRLEARFSRIAEILRYRGGDDG